MRWVVWPVFALWAVVLAVWVTRRWRSGRRVVLLGRVSPVVVRMVAILLVAVGLGAETVSAQGRGGRGSKRTLRGGISADDPVRRIDAIMRIAEVERFKAAYVLLRAGRPSDSEALALVRKIPGYIARLLEDDVRRLQRGEPVRPLDARRIANALRGLRRARYLDPWFAGWAWRRAATCADDARLRELLVEIETYAWHADCAVLAQTRLDHLVARPRAWASKGGPRLYRFPKNFGRIPAQTWRELYERSRETTWAREAVTPFRVLPTSASAQVERLESFLARPGTSFSFRRVDRVTAPPDARVLLEHGWVGRITVPAGHSVSALDLPDLLDAGQQETVRSTVARALEGDEPSQHLLQTSLPLCIPHIRSAVATASSARGAGALKLLLVLWDDAIPR